jgi:hypothetical protein
VIGAFVVPLGLAALGSSVVAPELSGPTTRVRRPGHWGAGRRGRGPPRRSAGRASPQPAQRLPRRHPVPISARSRSASRVDIAGDRQRGVDSRPTGTGCRRPTGSVPRARARRRLTPRLGRSIGSCRVVMVSLEHDRWVLVANIRSIRPRPVGAAPIRSPRRGRPPGGPTHDPQSARVAAPVPVAIAG